MQRDISALIATHFVLRFPAVSAAGLLPDRLATAGLAFAVGCVAVGCVAVGCVTVRCVRWVSPLPRILASHYLISWNILTFDQDWRRNTHR